MEKIFTYYQATISYRMEGKGKPVMLLHGFGEDSHIWDKQVAFLKEYCLLIVPDLPGSGKSSILSLGSEVRSQKSKVKSQKTEEVNKLIPGSQLQTPNTKRQTPRYISMEDYADSMYALLKHENISECTMLGHSMGGYITLAFAEKYPSALSAFGLIHSTAFADNEEKKKNREKGISFIQKHDGYTFLKNTIPNLFGTAFKEKHPEKVEALIEESQNFTKEALQQYYLAMMNRPDMTPVLKGNRLPVLFVMGTEDVAAPMEDVLQQTHLPYNSYIHVLQNTGHMGMWEATEQLNGMMLAFINRP